MTDDVFSSWKDNRFIVVNTGLVDDENGILVVLTDIGYWVDRTDSLIAWCKENNCVQKGMTVSLPSDRELSMFCLQWA